MPHLPNPTSFTKPHQHPTPLLLAILCYLTLATLPTPATAQDQVGIYWDTNYTQTTLTQDPVPGSATGYLVITDPSITGGIVGWELCVNKTGSALIYNWALSGQSFNLESEPCFSVALTEPLPPTGNAILLATFQAYVSTGEPTEFYLGHIPSPHGGIMSYTPAADTRYPIELSTAAGEGYPVAQILSNTPWPIFNTEAIDFGARSVGSVVEQNIVIENAGGGELELDISLSQDCIGFSLPDVSGLVTVPAGTSLTVPVTFTPLALESYSCTVEFGGTLPSVTLDGIGREPNYEYTLYSDRDFGEMFVGDSGELAIVLRNVGYDPIPTVPALVGCGDEFVIVSGGEPQILNRWDSHSVVVRFQPTVQDTFVCALSFGPDIDQVGLRGSSRTSGLYYEVPTEVNFGISEAGLYVNRTVSVRNTGTINFTVSPALVGCDNDFAITSGGEVVTLAPGYTRQIRVRFRPGSEGDFACALALGPLLPEVQLFGHGDPPTARYFVNPNSVNFSQVIEGETREATVRITNTGIINIGLDVQLIDTDPEFTLVEGAGLVDLQPSLLHLVRVRFQPNSAGYYSGVLDLGPTVSPVNISGDALAAVGDCSVSESELEFGNTLAMAPITKTFVVRNSGTLPLEVAPVSDSPHFSVNTTPFTLQLGDTRTIAVTFDGAELGAYSGTISLGNAVCSEVPCHVTVIEPIDPGPDALGIFFDEGFSANDTYPTAVAPFNAYLVLFNPSESSSIAGWECKLEIDGLAFLLSHSYPEQAINVGTNPDYVVYYASPLPPAAAVKLLTLQLLTVTEAEVITLSLSPTSAPSVPGQMSWIKEDAQSFVRMNTTTGQPVVATIYTEAPVGIEVPSPMLSQQNSQVHLTWPAPLQPGSTCHVYRRTATGVAERLTTEPLSVGIGIMEFADDPTGFAAGTTLFYSYAVVVEGIEVMRSPEVEYAFEGPSILVSQLLPNVPNPFNPQTSIRFKLAETNDVRVSIFDVTGRLVKVLENSTLAAGEYSRIWQGRDESGRAVASGAYYVRLVMDNNVDSQKIMLLK